jgi:L-rhamnose isomerase/sugar isomerase
MKIGIDRIKALNAAASTEHQSQLESLRGRLERHGFNTESIIQALMDFQVAIPSWALGAGGTRFGRYSQGGEPATLEHKIEDVGLVHALSRSAGAISLHIPWDIPEDPETIKALASAHGIVFDAVNSNTFQDQPDQTHSYKLGSLCHEDPAVRAQAIAHNCAVVDHGIALGSKSLTVWLADGSNFPGQMHFRRSLDYTRDSLQQIYHHLPEDWKLFIEYKPYEPHVYSTVIPDWGTSLLLAQACGSRAYTLVDLGHHLPNTNIEQIVSTLLYQGKLGGFHFNDSKYGDDDLTVGAIKPFQLYLIFNELVDGLEHNSAHNPNPAWMIDASHNLKDPLEDLLQSLDAILIAYAQALLVDRPGITEAQKNCDPTWAQEIIQDAFRNDVRPLVREARRRSGGAIHPIQAYRTLEVRQHLIRSRGSKTVATGL